MNCSSKCHPCNSCLAESHLHADVHVLSVPPPYGGSCHDPDVGNELWLSNQLPFKAPLKKKENMKDVLRRPWGNDLHCEGLAARTWHHSLRASSQRPLDVQHIVCCKKKNSAKKQRSKGYQAAVSNKRMLLTRLVKHSVEYFSPLCSMDSKFKLADDVKRLISQEGGQECCGTCPSMFNLVPTDCPYPHLARAPLCQTGWGVLCQQTETRIHSLDSLTDFLTLSQNHFT